MLFMDFSQIVISSIMEYHSRTKTQPSLEVVRSIALTNILFHKKKLRKFFNSDQDIYLCIDGRTYWRRQIFSPYKQNRLKSKKESTFDWNSFFVSFNALKLEFVESLPFHWIEYNGAEADDIIAVLVEYFCDPRVENVIVSSDKDFLQLQLHVCPNLKQFSSWHKKFLTPENTEYDFFQHLIKGDHGDGIPNILSDDDVFINENKRSKPIRDAKIEEWRFKPIEEFCTTPEILERYKRNSQLIDLKQIPPHIINGIKEVVQNSKTVQSKFFDYLSSHRLTEIMERGF